MTSTINASTSSGIVSSADTSGVLALQSNGTTALTVGPGYAVSTTNTINTPGVSLGFKNRIINGGMTIDQRNAGASVSAAANPTYFTDRWAFFGSPTSKFTAQQSTTAPAGFINSLLLTSSSAYTVGSGDYIRVGQRIEGSNVADLNWGTANAKTVTLSFWVRSSLTGTFGGSLQNSAQDRAYPYTYTISSANTFEYKTITIPGDTSGTWLTTSGIGIELNFQLGAGSNYVGTAGSWAAASYVGATGAQNLVATNGATFYITGVQLEVGTAATSFEFRDIGRELFMCQRYFEKSYDQSVKPGTAASGGYITSTIGTNTMISFQNHCAIFFAAEKRISTPTMVCYGYSGGTSVVSNGSNGADLAANSGILNARSSRIASFYNNAGSLATGGGSVLFHYTADAEL